jgi:CxxC-x17-CxxC domain-containing protein
MRRMQSTSVSGLDAVIQVLGRDENSPRRPTDPHSAQKDYSVPDLFPAPQSWTQKTVASERKVNRLKRILARRCQLGCTISTRRHMAGDIQLTCSDCGQDFTFTSADQAFFQERGYSTPKRCKNCRQAKKNDQGGSGYRSAPAQGTPVICSGCGQPTTVPFEPRGDRPVFCRDCYQARKGSGGGGGGSSRGRGR